MHLHRRALLRLLPEAYLVASLITPEDAFREGIRRVVARVDAAT